ncbi:hypothetical protein TL16_g13230, partial [Triparma laevis f. inornata]
AERKAIAQQVREQAIKAGADAAQLMQVSDDALLTLATNTTCEITALTVPYAKNANTAVSMYSDDKAKNKNLPFNKKATGLARACGHGQAELFGDAFVSRYYDDEAADIWERKDFTVSDSLPNAAWCTLGGGGTGKGSGSSLSNLMSKMGNSGGQPQPNTIDMGKSAQPALGVGEQTEVQQIKGEVGGQQKYTWSQSADEVEIKLKVEKSTKSKYIKCKFTAKTIKVTIQGTTFLTGSLGGGIIIDDCTYTLAEGELCVTLGKRQGETQWPYAVKIE